jgi:hypothetical protein
VTARHTEDLPARWGGEEFRVALEEWLLPALAEAGVTVTGPLVRDRIRFWSTLLHVESDGGRVWVKENAPSQAFEARLVAAVHDVAPGAVAVPLAVEPQRGWLATADLGAPLWDDEAPPAVEWVGVLRTWTAWQVALADHEPELVATGVPRFPRGADDVVRWVRGVLDELAGLPSADPRRATEDDVAVVGAGLERIGEAADALAASSLPDSLQHNDLHLGNALRGRDGGYAVIDLGDALWTHPLTTSRILRWVMRHRLGHEPGSPEQVAAEEAAVGAWAGHADPAALRALLPAADRVSCLHRAESWRRLQSDVPVEAVDEPFRRSVVDWLTLAAAEDPYAAAVSG